MSYADQRGMLRNALVAAGLSQDAAANIANILGNASQDSLQSSRSRADTTPDGLRLVDADARTHVFQNIDFRAGDPDHRAQQVADSEQRVQPQPASNVTEQTPPQQTAANFRVSSGSLANAQGAGDRVEVGVRARIAKQPPGRLPMTLLDRQTNTFVGKGIRANTDGEGRTRVSVNEGQRDVDWNFQVEGVTTHKVVTGLEFEPGVGLKVQYSSIGAWDDRRKDIRWLHMSEQRVLTEIVDDLKGPRAHTAYIPSFQSLARISTNGTSPNTSIRGNLGDDLYFNLFRIGTFTGAWAVGATKSVTQVWPAGGRSVTVMNLTRDVPNTSGTKYVLFAPRTEDQVKAEEVRGEDENPDPQIDAGEQVPDVTYIAIEIQQADADCVAFQSLNGKRVSDLCGYNGSGTVVQALSHNSDGGACGSGCLQWRGEKIDVVTDVSLAIVGANLVLSLTKRPVHILKADPAATITGGTIPITDCPTPSPGGGGV